MEKAIFGAGCFWGVEATFRGIPGVAEVFSGYSGGAVEDPSYEQVCSGATGHAEVVEVRFDPEQVSYGKLLGAFWQLHDPTQVDRQGPDVGSQYRSAIFYLSDAQREQAIASRDVRQKQLDRPIATEITQAGQFYLAEAYHQRYFEKHGIQGCAVKL